MTNHNGSTELERSVKDYLGRSVFFFFSFFFFVLFEGGGGEEGEVDGGGGKLFLLDPNLTQ